MRTKTITVSVRADVEEKFRKIARATLGKKKGHLGMAMTEAMEKWSSEKEQKDTVAATLKLLDEGVITHGIKYKSREELHER